VNRLLAALPRDEHTRLVTHGLRVHLPQGTVLCELGGPVHYAYFPESAMVSLLSLTHDGHTIELATVGAEGIAGIEIVLNASSASYRMVVQLATHALRIRADTLKTEFDRSPHLRQVLLRYTRTLLAQISQSAVCHRFHTATQRLARRLLIARDRVDSDTVEITQEFMANMLGIPRTGVTMAAAGLQDAGLIRQRHGKIHILNRAALEDTACECYQIVKGEQGDFPPARAS
jgi:CRP-like cAMP-binding protein